jgi:hypothetical protein
MKNRKLIIVLFLIVCSPGLYSQKLNYNKVKSELTNFLIENKEILEHNVENYKTGKYSLTLKGVLNYNQELKGELKDGLYLFTTGSSHSFNHYILVENDNYLIFELKSEVSLNESLKQTLEFCRRKKICSDIVIEYTDRLIGTYLNINKNPTAGQDVNCESGINDKSKLP